MTQILNQSTLREIRQALSVPNSYNAPSYSSDQVIPVVNVNPKDYKESKYATLSKTNTGTATIYTTDLNKDTFLTSVQLSFAKDATCDAATGSVVLQAIPFGLTSQTAIVSIATITLTAQSGNIFLEFNKPVKIARNTAIQIGGFSYTVGIMSRQATITYIETDVYEQ